MASIDYLQSAIRKSLTSRISSNRRVALVDFPDSLNCGDLAIWSGEKRFLKSIGVKTVYECSMQSYDAAAMRTAISADGLILMHGGGNFGDRYVYHEFRARVLKDFPNNDALLFPQTANFRDVEKLSASAALYNARGRLTLCARDHDSATLLRTYFHGCEVIALPDMATMIGPLSRNPPQVDVLWLARGDSESRFGLPSVLREVSQAARGTMQIDMRGLPAPAFVDTHVGDGVCITDWYNLRLADQGALDAYRALPFDARAEVQLEWARLILSIGKVVVTDRLHGHIVCTLLAIPHILLDNDYGKLRSYVRSWGADESLTQFAETPEEALALAKRSLIRCGGVVPAQGTARKVISQRLTYLSEARLLSIAATCERLEAENVPGIFLEAGTALGGSAVVIAMSKRQARTLRLFDVFKTIPPPSAHDGVDVHARYTQIAAGLSQGIGGDPYYGYLPDLENKVRENLAQFGIVAAIDNVELVPGLFEETLHPDGPVAFAHIDGDWYESVKICLTRIAPRLAIGGAMVIDDYSDWSGCRKAVDEFMSTHGSEFEMQIEPIGPAHIFRKRPSSTANLDWGTSSALSPHWSHRAHEVARHIPPRSHVLDLACGAMDLERLLGADCLYTPSDLVRRDARTLVCDVRKDPLPRVPDATIVTALGLCEYLPDLPDFFRKLRGLGLPVLLSYVPLDEATIPLAHRETLGWISHLGLANWIFSLESSGFKVEVLQRLRLDPTQYLFRLR
jgi:asparagine synthase (glutamine-hydrolysing)